MIRTLAFIAVLIAAAVAVLLAVGNANARPDAFLTAQGHAKP